MDFRFAVDFLYGLLYNKSTTNRISGALWAYGSSYTSNIMAGSRGGGREVVGGGNQSHSPPARGHGSAVSPPPTQRCPGGDPAAEGFSCTNK